MSKTAVSTNKMKIKMNFVLAIMVILGFGTLIGRLYYLQFVEGEKYQAMALKQQLRPTAISAQRGTIYDRNLKTLAASATVWNVIISPAEIESEEELGKIADYLSVLLEVDREKIITRGQKKSSYYETIKQKVEKDVADQITQFILDEKISGIYLIEDTKRYYPYGNLASTVLGFTGDQNKGAYGLEAYYDKTLSGMPGMVISAKNAKGAELPNSYRQLYEPENGNSVVLTIDEVIQHVLEKNLEAAVVEHNVDNRAVGIVMDIKTGEILAMSTKPDFDPNDPRTLTDPKAIARVDAAASEEERIELLQEEQFLQWRNKAISDPYEPGSVFKIVTAATALDLGVVTPEGQYFNCPGYHIVAGRRKSCWKVAGHGTIDFTQAVKFSCNPAFMMIGARIGPENFYNYFERFGFKEPTRIDLPGEAEGFSYSLEMLSKPSGEELASSSFGQTFTVTPIQLITAVSAVVNDGKLMQPYIVKQVLDSEGNIVSTTEPVVVRQVITSETSATMRGILERVVGDEDGSGRKAYVPGYRVGGKTGTSEKLQKNNAEGGKFYITSFYGFAPANDPQVGVLVLLDEPHVGNIYGSVIAAPVVGAVLSEILPYLGIEPQYTEKELEQIDIQVPYLIGELLHDATSALTQKGLDYKTVGEGTTITKQIPASGQPIPKGGTVILYTDEVPEVTMVEVPDVVGLSGQQANRTILNAGLNIKITGLGIENAASVAISQNPAPGEEVEAGTVITVDFAAKDLAG